VIRPLLFLLVLLPAAAQAADVVGPETCKACHPRAYDAWKESPHARALESLPEARRKDARCTSCHAPDIDKDVAGVTCEACHGGGRVYAQAFIMRDRELARAVGLVDPGEKSCLGCHTDTAPSLVRFDFNKKMPIIEHREPREPPPAPPPPARTPAKGKVRS
jgi:hypothetical protein